MALNKEFWLPEIMEGFYPDDSFLKEARDLSAFVENDKIHLADAGVNPNVLVNNTTYPVPMAERADTPLEITMDYYDTENTVLRNAEKAELSYDKRASVLFGHRQSLMVYFMQKAAHAFAPASDSLDTPVMSTSGANNGSGKKLLTFDDLYDFESKWDEAEIPSEGRILVLSTQHLADLKKEDKKLYKEILKDKEFLSFKLFKMASKRMAVFNSATGVKKAYGAAAAGTDAISSLAFHKNEVMRADGSLDMFVTEKDPGARGDIIGFQKRGIALPLRGKGIGAIYTATV